MNIYLKKNKLKLIIVDFDNTLFFTNNINFKSYQKVFNYYNIKLTKKNFDTHAGLSKQLFYRKIFRKKPFAVKTVFDISYFVSHVGTSVSVDGNSSQYHLCQCFACIVLFRSSPA